MARSVDRIAVLTGTLMGGYADDLFNVLYRLEPQTDGDRRLRVLREVRVRNYQRTTACSSE